MNEKYVITIAHLLGCGGAYIGNKLSEKLAVPFVDRQILKKVADVLELSEKDIEDREEKKSSFWDVFFREEALSEASTAITEDFMPSDKELYELEMQYIEKIVNENSCIILGRGGNYILRDQPRHLKVFVYADMDDRIHRVSELYNVSESASRRIIEKNDKERHAYIKTYTGRDMLNLNFYDICLNTSKIGTDNAAMLIEKALDFQEWKS